MMKPLYFLTVLISFLFAIHQTVAEVGCSCTCVPQEDGTFKETAYIDDGTCGIPDKCEGSTAITAEVACYKCGQQLNCVVDPDSLTETQHDLIAAEILKKLDSGFCKETRNKKSTRLVTTCGQQNCESVKVAPYGTRATCPVIGLVNCPVDTKFGLSNFATYTITVGAGDDCPTCTATGMCEGSGTFSCTPTECVSVESSITCSSEKCDTTTCDCDICDCAR